MGVRAWAGMFVVVCLFVFQYIYKGFIMALCISMSTKLRYAGIWVDASLYPALGHSLPPPVPLDLGRQSCAPGVAPGAVPGLFQGFPKQLGLKE